MPPLTQYREKFDAVLGHWLIEAEIDEENVLIRSKWKCADGQERTVVMPTNQRLCPMEAVTTAIQTILDQMSNHQGSKPQ